MKLKRSLPVLLATLCIYLTACQKEISADNGLFPVPAADSNYLDKLYDLYDNGAGVDTQEIYTVHYDNLKRVSSISDSLVTATGPEHFESFYYSYNGTDTLPYRSVQVVTESSSYFDSLSTYHFYDAQKRKSQDSTVETYGPMGAAYTVSKRIIAYSYGAGKLYGETAATDITPAGVTFFTRDTADVNSNGDIITNKKYRFNGTGYDLYVTSNYTYDTHANPFSILSNFLAHRYFPNGETLIFEYMGHNNMLTQNEFTIPSSYNFSVSVNYVYNTAGFPIIENYLGPALDEKLIYTYKTL